MKCKCGCGNIIVQKSIYRKSIFINGHNTNLLTKEDYKKRSIKISKSKMGHKVDNTTKQRISDTVKNHWINGVYKSRKYTGCPEEKNGAWKGDKVGYFALHGWVYRTLGKPVECIFCTSKKKLNWANKSGNYKRDINDWISLCRKCHHNYDNISTKAWITKKAMQGVQ